MSVKDSEEVPKVFYKYYAPMNGIENVLGKGTIKWSTPIEFNDPFDNQYEHQFEEYDDSMLEELSDIFLNQSFNAEQIAVGFGRVVPGEVIAEMVKDISNSAEGERFLKDVVSKSLPRFFASLPEFNKDFREEMQKSAIFCVTDSFDNGLMWAHYAQSHSGLVVAFAPSEPNSPLYAAEPVRYSESLPVTKLADHLTAYSNMDNWIRKLTQTYTLTKGNIWSYEREWRVLTAGGAGIRPFEKREVVAVYMGCRMKPENRENVIVLVRSKYPWADLFQLTMNPKKFEFIVEKVDT